MRCLPQVKIPQIAGNVLHDWHAEIVAIRAFNCWLLDSCRSLTSEVTENAAAETPRVVEKTMAGELVEASAFDASVWLRERGIEERTPQTLQPFAIRDDVHIFMYCSEAPCGDASMELVMAAQDDATPWETPATLENDTAATEPSLKGRGSFSELGIVRRKPSRPDAPPTLSKSCSDKIVQAQFLSLLSSSTSLIVHPGNAYLTSLVLPSSQLVPAAISRAFLPGGRMGALRENVELAWQGGYNCRWFSAEATDLEFRWSRRQSTGQTLIPSNITAVYTPHFQETLIGGVLQGRKQFDPRGASKICRRALLGAVIEVATAAGTIALVDLLKKSSYLNVKESSVLTDRRKVKNDIRKVLTPEGWVKNTGDDWWVFSETGKV